MLGPTITTSSSCAVLRAYYSPFTRISLVLYELVDFGSKSCNLTRGTYNAIKEEHRQLHEAMVRPPHFTSSGSLVTILPTPMSMVSVNHAAAMCGTPMGPALSLRPLILRGVRRVAHTCGSVWFPLSMSNKERSSDLSKR